MASEIRVNRLSNRSGLSTITFANGGVQFSGITTFANGEFYVGTGATIINPGTNEFNFHTGGSNRFTINNSGVNLGTGNITAVDGTFTGNVSIAKTLTYEDVKNVDSVGVVTARTGVKVTGGDFTVGTAITASSVTGNVTQDVGITTYSGSAVWFKGATANKDMYWSHASGATVYKDNAQILMGDSSDLQIYHSGSHSFIKDAGTGMLKICADMLDIRNAADNATLAYAQEGNKFELFYAGNAKLATTNTGVNITGVTVDDGATHDGDVSFTGANWSAMWDKSKSALILNDNAQINFGTDEDGDIYHDNSQMIINNATGILRIRSSEVRLCNPTNSTYFTGISGGAAKLYHNDSVKLETTSSGAKVTGTLELTDSLYWDGDTNTTIDNAGGTADFIRFKTGGTTVMDIDASQNVKLHDNRRLKIGASDDIQIFHSSSSNINYFYCPQNNVFHEFNVGNSWTVQTTAGDDRIVCPGNGTSTAVELYHNGSRRFHTKSEGVAVEGSVNLEGSQATFPSHGGMTRHTNAYVYFTGKSDGNGAILSNGDGTATFRALNPGSSAGYVLIETGNGDTRLTITSDGHFGTNGVTPTTQSGKVFHLHAGAAQQRFHMTNSTTGSGATDGFEIIVEQSANTRIRNFEAGDMAFDTGGSNNEVMRITSGGALLVGLSSPTYNSGDMQHEIKKNNSRTYTAPLMSSHAHLLLNNSDTTNNVFCGLGFRAGSGDGAIGYVYRGSANNADFVVNTDGNANGAERFRIFNSGSVLIGALSGEAAGGASSSGSAKLVIDCEGLNVLDGAGNAANYGLVFANDPTTDKANGIGFFNDGGTACGGYIIHQDKGGNNIGDLIFATSETADTPVERLRITSDGKFYLNNDSKKEIAPVYHDYVSCTGNAWTKFATIDGNQLSSEIYMTAQDTLNSVVITASFLIKVAHYQDIWIESRSMAYSELKIKVISNNNQHFDLYMQRTSGSTASNVEVSIFPQNQEGVTFSSNVNYSGQSLEHTTSAGTLKITGAGGVQSNINVAGSITGSSKNFSIEHPLTSLASTKKLVHASIEGPQLDLIYRGKVDLVGGSATVNIDTAAGMSDGTFVLMNSNVQCFTTNETGWSAIKGSVSGNILTITAQDNSSTDTISWMVVGERQDDTIKSSNVTDDSGKLIVEPLIFEETDNSSKAQYYPT